MNKKKKNNLLNWLFHEGAIQKKENVYIADRAFLANAFINWIRDEVKNKNLNPEDIEKKMNILRLFLKKEIDLKWNDNATQIIETPSSKKRKNREIENYKTNKDVV